MAILSSSRGAGVRFTATEDTTVPVGVEVVSTNLPAITGDAAGIDYRVAGTVQGTTAIDHGIGTNTALDLTLKVDKTGYLSGTAAAISLIGTGAVIDNAGTINGRDAAFAMGSNGGTTKLTNSGSILSSSDALVFEGRYDKLTVVNTGLIAGNGYAFYTGNSPVTLVNSGKMVGQISLGDGNGLYDGRKGQVHGLIMGEGGEDRFRPGNFADTINGGDGFDTVDFRSTTGVTLNLATPSQNRGAAKGDTYLDIERFDGSAKGADRLTGDARDQWLFGHGGNDTLSGGGGLDWITGGAGQDRMSGGADAVTDWFVFTKVSDSAVGSRRDTITDFVSGTDRFVLTEFDANANRDGLQTLSFSGTTAKAHSVWYARSGADAIVRIDVTGDRQADFEVKLDGVSTLTSADFVFIFA